MEKTYSIDELREIFQTALDSIRQELLEASPKDLYLPVDYSLKIGGKRLRPVLAMMAYNLFKDDLDEVLPIALAMEVFHNFTLLHDDIMDKADVRRNQPTVHKKFNENSAILSGDAMAFLSYRYLLRSNAGQITRIIDLFSQTAIEVCEGQQLDMDFEERLDVKEEEYLEMIRLKTAVLLACSLQSGALAANADEESCKLLYEFGINLGLAFQLQDDLLDTFGTQETFGKKIGGDIESNKKTFLLIKALQMADEKAIAEITAWISKTDFDPEEKIMAVRNIFSQLDIKHLTQLKIQYYFEKSHSLLEKLAIPENKKEVLFVLANRMLKRNS